MERMAEAPENSPTPLATGVLEQVNYIVRYKYPGVYPGVYPAGVTPLGILALLWGPLLGI